MNGECKHGFADGTCRQCYREEKPRPKLDIKSVKRRALHPESVLVDPQPGCVCPFNGVAADYFRDVPLLMTEVERLQKGWDDTETALFAWMEKEKSRSIESGKLKSYLDRAMGALKSIRGELIRHGSSRNRDDDGCWGCVIHEEAREALAAIEKELR